MSLHRDLKIITGKSLTPDTYEPFFKDLSISGKFDLKLMQTLLILLLKKVEELEERLSIQDHG